MTHQVNQVNKEIINQYKKKSEVEGRGEEEGEEAEGVDSEKRCLASVEFFQSGLLPPPFSMAFLVRQWQAFM